MLAAGCTSWCVHLNPLQAGSIQGFAGALYPAQAQPAAVLLPPLPARGTPKDQTNTPAELQGYCIGSVTSNRAAKMLHLTSRVCKHTICDNSNSRPSAEDKTSYVHLCNALERHMLMYNAS